MCLEINTGYSKDIDNIVLADIDMGISFINALSTVHKSYRQYFVTRQQN